MLTGRGQVVSEGTDKPRSAEHQIGFPSWPLDANGSQRSTERPTVISSPGNVTMHMGPHAHPCIFPHPTVTLKNSFVVLFVVVLLYFQFWGLPQTYKTISIKKGIKLFYQGKTNVCSEVQLCVWECGWMAGKFRSESSLFSWCNIKLVEMGSLGHSLG